MISNNDLMKALYSGDLEALKTSLENGADLHYANIMGLKSRKGAPVSTNTIYYMLSNTFYYGEMKTIRSLMPHVYKPIISKELWDSCQHQKTLTNQYLQGNDNENVQFGSLKSYEPQIFDKKTRGYIKKCNLSPNW